MNERATTVSSLPQVARIAGLVSHWSLLALIFLMPLLYLPWTSNVLEVNKQMLLVVLGTVSGLSWLGSMLAAREFSLRRSFLNVAVLVLLLVTGLSTAMSSYRVGSFFGFDGGHYASFLTLLALVIVYFLVANSARTLRSARQLFWAFFSSNAVVSILGILAVAGVTLPGGVGANFNTVGTIFGLAMYLAVTLLFSAGVLLIDSKEHDGIIPKGVWGLVGKIVLWVSGAASLFVLVAVDFQPAWITLILGSLVLLVFGIVFPQDYPDMTKFVMPLLLFVIALLFSFVRSPMRFQIPVEVGPSLKGSWAIARQALRDNPMLGSGPSTYTFDFSKYRDVGLNETVFWNVRFDRANSHVMTLLATTGILGLLAYLFVMGVALVRGVQYALQSKEREARHMALMILTAFVGMVIVRFAYASTMTMEFLFWFLLGLLTVAVSTGSLKKSFPEAPRMSLALSFLFVLLLVSGIGFTYLTLQRYVGDIRFAQAVSADREGNLDEAIKKLDSARLLDSSNDAYYRNLSQALLLKMNDVAATPAKDDAEKARLERQLVELAQGVVETARAAQSLSPENVANASQLAFVYQNIAGFVQNSEEALGQARSTYEAAAKLEPNNPVYPTQIGRIYLSQAALARQLTTDKDEAVKTKAEADMKEHLGKAEDAFNKALQLKKDYAPAQFNLALTFDLQGRSKDAIAQMEKTSQDNPSDIGVYFQLGILYYRDGAKDKAKTSLEKAIQLSPNYANALWYLATIYEEEKNVAKATELVQRVYDLNKSDELVKARLEKLTGGKVSEPGLPEPVGTPASETSIGAGE